MTKHVKPTAEELEANANKAVEELEQMDKPKETSEEETQEEKPKEEPEKEVKEEVKEETSEEETVDYKKKFIESAKEAQILHAKNKKVNEALDMVINTPDPTEEELKKEYTDWDVMSDFEKKMAKDSLSNSKRFRGLEEITKDSKSVEKWNTKVDEYIQDPNTLNKVPELEGKEDEFKLFASKPTRRNMDFADITAAFLYDATKNAKPKQKGKMMETGTGGPSDKGKPSGKISVDEAMKLKKVDYARYKQLLMADKIDLETI